MMPSSFPGLLAFLLLVGFVGAGGTAAPARCSPDCLLGRGLAFSGSKDLVRFSVGGREVSAAFFCRAVGFCAAKGCHGDWKKIREEYCSGNLSISTPDDGIFDDVAVKIYRIADRKTLHRFLTNSSSNEVAKQEGKQRNVHLTFSSEKMPAIAFSAFLLCCVFLCPCFYPKRKGNQHEATSSTELQKVNSVPSSIDTRNLSERSQARTPLSPLRVPPSLVRVPPSPSRFSLSRLSRSGSVHLSLNQIARATQGFSPSNVIGDGGFGTVYKAQLPDGQIVAIKRARKEHAAKLKAEFSNEVELLSKIEHRNLVKLLGYTEKGNEKIIITEYVSNGNLREHLDGLHGHILDFYQRLEIAIDVAHALTYLHSYAEKEVIHRDVKSSNILLTEGLRAKVADFGFARIGPTNEDQTHISTNVKGTAGYLDPEYLRTCQLTQKSDVFSFGILLIEILTGRRPVEVNRVFNERITVKWAFKKFEEGNITDLLDPELEEVVDEEIPSKLFDLAFQCAAPTRVDRPLMKEVVEKLWQIRKDFSRSRKVNN